MECVILKENEPLDLLPRDGDIFPVRAFMNPVRGYSQVTHDCNLVNVAFSVLLPRVEYHASIPCGLCFNKSVQGNA